jgi:hypothetical protein
MIYTFKFKIDIATPVYIPFTSFSYRQKNGDTSYFSAVIPTLDLMETISDNSESTFTVDVYKDGVFLNNFLQTNFENLVPNIGANKQTAMFYGEKQQTWEPPVPAVPLQHILYYAPNRTDAKYTFHGCQLIENLKAGYDVSYKGDTFTLDEIQYNISTERINIYYKES